MTKKFNLLLILVFVFILASCNNNKKTSKPGIMVPGFVDESRDVTSVRIIDVPSEPIQIGHFSNANIKLEATYTDGTKSYKTITEEFFREEDLELLKTPGEKYFEFLYKNNRLALRFTLVEAISTPRFQVIFKNREGKTLQADMINYLDEAKFYSTKSLDYEENGKYYRFTGEWSESVKHIYKYTEVTPKYVECKTVSSFDEFYDRTPLYNMSYRMVSRGTHDNDILIYVGRINNVPLINLGTVNRNDYKLTSLEYQKESYTRINFVKEIANNLQNNIIYNNYYHDSADNNHIRCKIMNSNVLNFDLEKEELINDLSLPECFLRAPSDRGFIAMSLDRGDGIITSDKSVLNHLVVTPYDLYNEDNSNILKVIEDYPLGYYDYSLYANLDVYIATKYDIELVGDQEQYTLSDVKICFTFSDLRFDYIYRKTEDENNVHGNRLVINDRLLAFAIYKSRND